MFQITVSFNTTSAVNWYLIIIHNKGEFVPTFNRVFGSEYILAKSIAPGWQANNSKANLSEGWTYSKYFDITKTGMIKLNTVKEPCKADHLDKSVDELDFDSDGE